MADTNRTALRHALLAGYARLKDRLARRLGSSDLAGEALQETWLRLEGSGDLAPVGNHEAYLYRAALNTAANQRRASAHRLDEVEIDSILGLADDRPDPERRAAARQEMTMLAAALAELPARQREVFRESFTHGTPQSELAVRFGVSTRTIQSDLERAVAHCARRLGKKNFFASSRARVSGNKEGMPS